MLEKKIERKFPAKWCPIEIRNKQLMEFAAPANGQVLITFEAAGNQGHHIDNIAIVTLSFFDDNSGPVHSCCNCYGDDGLQTGTGSSGYSRAIGLFQNPAALETYPFIELFDSAPDDSPNRDWCLSNGAFYDPQSSAPRRTTMGCSTGNTGDFSGGSISFGDGFSPGPGVASLLVGGLVPGQTYVLVGWWDYGGGDESQPDVAGDPYELTVVVKSWAGGPVLAGSVSGHATLCGAQDHSGIIVTASGPSIAADTTASDGTYQIGNLCLPGTYTLSATRPGYINASQAGVSVASGVATTGVDLLLRGVADVVHVTYPDGGEQFANGDSVTITWTAPICTPSVRIELRRNSTLCAVLAENAPNTGSFTTVLSQCSTPDEYRIRVRDLVFALSDDSNGDFSFRQTLVVDQAGSGDYSRIQDALNASIPGDSIIVLPGTYSGTRNKDLSFNGKAVTLSSRDGPAVTIIDCAGSGRGFNFNNGEGLASVVEGFTIRGGSASPGAGIRCNNSSPTIRNCVITDNTVSDDGAGFWLRNSTANFEDCIIANNVAGAPTGTGGGGYVEDSAPTFVSCVFSGNVANRGDGGGLFLSTGNPISIVSCTVTGNSANRGGGVYKRGNGTLALTGCTISANLAELAVQPGSGGGIYHENGDVYSNHSIIWGNCSDHLNDREILSSAAPDTLLFECTVTNPDGIQGDFVEIGINVFADPLFCAPDSCAAAPTTAGDYSLDGASPARNVANCGLIGAHGVGCGVSAVSEDHRPDFGPSLRLSANPARDEVTIFHSIPPSDAEAHLEVFDVSGRLVWSTRLSKGATSTVWRTEDRGGHRLAQGIYFVRLRSNTISATRSVAILR